MNIGIKKLHPEAIIPSRQTDLASGFDLYALDVICPDGKITPEYNEQWMVHVLYPGERVLVRTGIALQMETGVEAQVRPRSGLAFKYGVTVVNTPGTIDADYTGDVGVILINHGKEPFVLQRFDRIAQLVFQQVPDVRWVPVVAIKETDRGDGGFGHTGVSA